MREVLPDPGASKKYAEKREASLAPTAAGRSVGFHSASGTGFGHRRSRATRKVAQRETESGRHRWAASVRSASRERRRGAASPASDVWSCDIRTSDRGDWRPPRCIPRSRGAASRNRELGPAPSEAREGPAASSSHPSPRSLSSAGGSDLLAPRSIPRRRGRDPRRIASTDPHGGDPRYTRWVANHRRDRSFRCRE